MSDGTGISWTDATWNVVKGCSIVSPGCSSCYAMRMAARLEAMRQKPYAGLTHKVNGRTVWTGKVFCDAEALAVPLRWKRPRRIFVPSMGDLFHPDVPFDFIDRVFAVMALCPQHTFQVLTKRPERAAEYTTRGYDPIVFSMQANLPKQLIADRVRDGAGGVWPLPNVWLGTSVEDQARADERIPHLLKCPAAVRFLSCEPLLGPVDLMDMRHGADPDLPVHGTQWGVDWVIAGGESGPNARPCNVEWVRGIVSQCKAASVPVFVKQLGAIPFLDETSYEKEVEGPWLKTTLFCGERAGQPYAIGLEDRKGGDLDEWPEDLRVREWPNEKGR